MERMCRSTQVKRVWGLLRHGACPLQVLCSAKQVDDRTVSVGGWGYRRSAFHCFAASIRSVRAGKVSLGALGVCLHRRLTRRPARGADLAVLVRVLGRSKTV